ncbi:hypothetical protein Nepgr_016408 [Nepenthes gracilis]|uniref:Uncharacterized protein n=1 Tax=Nepenthes gracilis TaxID=150966 RepID=A0AAD3SQD1_NEPGR|nr:hypothetical protein Nepgr_016408 [Nepenthes gracilis]
MTDVVSPELVVDVQTVVLQPNYEVEKSTVSDRDVLGNPLHALDLVEVVHENQSLSVVLSINGADLDLTPNSVTKHSCNLACVPCFRSANGWTEWLVFLAGRSA